MPQPGPLIQDSNQELLHQRWLDGDYCYVGERDGLVYKKTGRTIPDTLYLTKFNPDQDGTHSNCSAGKYVIKHVKPGSDFEDPKSGYMELRGNTVLCVGSTDAQMDFLASVMSLGHAHAGSNYYGSISAIGCGAPNTTSGDEDDEKDDKEEGVSPIVLDDPASIAPADHWMHPCDCFPEAWGNNPPVLSGSFQAVPEGSNNKFTPPPVLLVMGSFVCPFKFNLSKRYLLDGRDSEDSPTCETLCIQGSSSCNYFLDGATMGSKQCRLYEACEWLVREAGSDGSLRAILTSGNNYCHIADPTRCWAVTVRRQFLDANLAWSAGPNVQMGCAWYEQLKQCDHKLLIGGMGIKDCGKCNYKVRKFSWKPPHCTQSSSDKRYDLPKTPLPKRFKHGQRLGVFCWTERFRPVSLTPGQKIYLNQGETLTCVSGKWLAMSGGKPGLSNLACAACIQVVRNSFTRLNDQLNDRVCWSESD